MWSKAADRVCHGEDGLKGECLGHLLLQGLDLDRARKNHVTHDGPDQKDECGMSSLIRGS